MRSKPTPQPIATLSGHFIEDIAVGAEHTLAVTSNGDVFGWGNNADGQLGLGHTNTVRTPQIITSLSGKGIRKVRDNSIYQIQKVFEVGSKLAWGLYIYLIDVSRDLDVVVVLPAFMRRQLFLASSHSNSYL